MQSRTFFEILEKINQDINRQIPLASNRFDEYEICAKEADTADTDALDSRYFAHCERYRQARNAYFINQNLKVVFDQYCNQHQIQAAQSLPESELQKLRSYMLSQTSKICAKLERMERLLHVKMPNALQISEFLAMHIDQIIHNLCHGLSLPIPHEEYRQRFMLDEQLVEHRDIMQKQIFSNSQMLLSQALTSENYHLIKKLHVINSGRYLDDVQSNVGYCDEHASLGLKRILEQFGYANKDIKSLEKISISYEEGDGHTFLAINRDQASKLNDFASWGSEAIIFDSWNKLVCFASDYSDLPRQYLSYPTDAAWVSLAFDFKHDKSMQSKVRDADQFFEIAGNKESKQRYKLMKEEYKLKSLQYKKYNELRKYLKHLVAECMPDNFNVKIKLYLTTAGNELVTAIPGFKTPVIAIHADFLKNMRPESTYDVQQLKFALSHLLLSIKLHGIGVSQNLLLVQLHEMDKKVIERFQCGQAAIRYLRQVVLFAFNDNQKIRVPAIQDVFDYNAKSVTENRIKNIITLLAQNAELSREVVTTYLPANALQEVSRLKHQVMFQKGMNAYATKLEKLYYLISQLDKLNVELLPYEFTNTPSVRVRDFSFLLTSLDINLYDQAESEVVDELVNKAFTLRIPAFDCIYLCLHGKADFDDNFSRLKPLGVFKELQFAISAFVQATDAEQADLTAAAVLQSHARLSDHFNDYTYDDFARKALRIFQDKHGGRLPHGGERYFGSQLGKEIDWSSFPDLSDRAVEIIGGSYLSAGLEVDISPIHAMNCKEDTSRLLRDIYPDKTTSWDQHLEWCLQYRSNSIAKVLWMLGLYEDMRFWQVFTNEELLAFIQDKTTPIMLAPGQFRKDKLTMHEFYKPYQILHYLSRHHHIDTSMFSLNISYEQAFIEFYDKNAFALNCPDVIFGTNFNKDNACIHYLLQSFLSVIRYGSIEDKKVVKSFFTGREDKRDFRALRQAHERMSSYSIDTDNVYTKFVIDQTYLEEMFSFFESEEIIKFIDQGDILVNAITWQQFSNMFDLPFDRLTVDCLEQLLPLLERYHNKFDIHSLFLQEHVKQNSHLLLSPDAIRLAKLTQKWSEKSMREIMFSMIWNLPETVEGIDDITAADLILIYRMIDSSLLFPSEEQRTHFNQLIIDKIAQLLTTDAKIDAMEAVLFISSSKLITAISDIQFRSLLINAWVKLLALKYGKDDDSDAYFAAVKPVIDRINNHAPGRDITKMLTCFANAIVSQWKVSEYLGILLEPEKFMIMDIQSRDKFALTTLANISSIMSDSQEDQHRMLDFFASPITHDRVIAFSNYLLNQQLARELLKEMDNSNWYSVGDEQQVKMTQTAVHTLYHLFWDRSLEERAVMIEYLLIPAKQVKTDIDAARAYDDGFNYVSTKLFPNAHVKKTDDEFICSFLKTYLDVADMHQRSFLLAGMLIASNASEGLSNQASPGKKLVLLCEHMGPAYIKLAQAIHSHPQTPAHIRQDLDHVKGKANPPHRWQLWRMIKEVLPASDISKVRHVGHLLGSASYNLAVSVTLNNGKKLVLSLLRENAERDALKGFNHIKQAVMQNEHRRIVRIRPTAVAMITEAQLMSVAEMQYELSLQQFAIARKVYGHEMRVGDYSIKIFPTHLIRGGEGYRFIDLVYGKEFNNLPTETTHDKEIITCIAKAVMTVELINILSGRYFDSDRHGNQLRIVIDEESHKIKVGLYDFGEMALANPSVDDVMRLVAVIKDIPPMVARQRGFEGVFEKIMTNHIEVATQHNHAISYLMRVRKGLLALQDFQKHLSEIDMIDVLLHAAQSSLIHPAIRESLSFSMKILAAADKYYTLKHKVSNTIAAFFSRAQRNDHPVPKITKMLGPASLN